MSAVLRLSVVSWQRWSEVGVFVATRTLNGITALLHAGVVIAVLGEAASGHYFLFWTASWLLSVLMRLGVDGVMPRVVAEATVGGTPLPSLRPAMAWSLLVGLVAAPG